MEKQKSLIGGVLLGSVIGVIAGLLLAPQSGVQTRKKISKKASDMKDDFIDAVSESIKSLKDRFNGKVDEMTRRTKEDADKINKKATVK